MNEDRKFAILFAATLLCARKRMDMDDKPSPGKLALVEIAIDKAKLILDQIDKRWPEASAARW